MSGVIFKRLGAPEGFARRFLVACMVLGFAALILAAAGAAWVTSRNAEHTRWVNHTYQVEVEVAHLRGVIEQTETARRGYLLTGLPAYLDNQRIAVVDVGPAVNDIATLTGDNPRQTLHLADLRRRLVDMQQQQEATIGLMLAGHRDQALASFTAETSAARLRGIRDVLTAMADEERRLLKLRDAEQRSSLRTFYIVLVMAGLLVVLVAIVSVATVMRYTRDLGAARDRLLLLNTGLESAVAERTADLTRANEEIQRFAYIVSHDLRSPLVNVMGFTAELDAARATLTDLVERAEGQAPDLVTDEARAAAREDLPEAIGFIRTSTQKMDRLINAILRLSREGRRVLSPEPLALADIASGVRDSLHQQAEARGAQIVVETPMPTLVGDRVAIEQVLSNLVENAVKYLQPGRAGRIVIRARAAGQRRIIEVADNGRGIAPNDHDRVFDLFRRAGQQDQPGEGIGLAHVRALTYRLGGTIDLSSTLGEGSVFRVTLPDTLAETGLSTRTTIIRCRSS